ncbi:hypothetical protein AB0B25_32205 [Nocardia sp. NPDC049190]|uniref:hypothetical protein n=1 Tax=Nocardia sp. NPDC049190 TaxID=3155650 RepID=UPI0033CEE4DA
MHLREIQHRAGIRSISESRQRNTRIRNNPAHIQLVSEPGDIVRTMPRQIEIHTQQRSHPEVTLIEGDNTQGLPETTSQLAQRGTHDRDIVGINNRDHRRRIVRHRRPSDLGTDIGHHVPAVINIARVVRITITPTVNYDKVRLHDILDTFE